MVAGAVFSQGFVGLDITIQHTRRAGRLLEVYRLQDGLWVLLSTYEGDALVHAEPFEVSEIDLKRLWGR